MSARDASASQITINRAPVLTLWAAVVAERLGYARDEALTFGKMVAGLTAATKAARLGLAKPHDPFKKKPPKRTPGEEVAIDLLGRVFVAVDTPDGLRALHRGKAVEPTVVDKYLTGKFGEDLEAARSAMTVLAKSRAPRVLAGEAFMLYEAFRPEIPRGTRGWGARGVLDLAKVTRLSETGA